MPPRRIRPFVAPQRSVEPPSTLRRILAGATRVAGGLYPLGGVVGAGLAGGAEALAEKIEGTDVDPRRMAVEGAIGAVPLGKYIQGGRALASMLKTGAMTGVGEAGREYARGEELDPKAIAIATGLGGATGGILGKIGGKPSGPVAASTPKPVPEAPIEPKARDAFVKTVESELGRHLKAIPSGATRDLKSFLTSLKETERSAGMARSTAQRDATRMQALEERADLDWTKSEAKAYQDARAEEEIRETIESGGMVRQEPAIRESLRGGRLSQSTAYRSMPAEGSPQREVFDKLVAQGLSPNEALNNVDKLAKLLPARVATAVTRPATTDPSSEMPSGDALGQMLSRVPAIGSRAAQTIPLAGPKEAIDAAASKGTATLEDINRSVGVEAIPTPPGARGTEPSNSLMAKLLQALESRQPASAGASVDPLAGMLRPDMPQTASARAGLFSDPIDVTGTAYRAAKADPSASRLAKQYLGVSLGKPDKLAAFLEKDLGPHLASGEAIPARGIPEAPQGLGMASEGLTAAPRTLPDRPLLSTTDLRQAMGVNEKTIDRWVKAGLIPGATRVGRQWRFRREEVEKAFNEGTLGRSKPPSGGEAGFAVPELMMGMTGAAAGAITDPFDNPVISALAGAGTGLAVPHILAGIKSLGVAPETLGNVEEQLQTQEGIIGLAKKIGRTLPHWQRANLLYSVPGLPANAAVGPWGAVFTGALTKALSGDPRGWAVLKSGDLWPTRFGKEWKASQQEALDLVRRADSKGTRFIEGAPVAQDVSAGPLRTYLETPARAMAMGDVAARRILTRHGFSEEEAKIMTLTSEPELPAMKKLARLREGERSPFMEMLAPFVRTGANVVEGSAHATPLLGFITSSMRKNVPSVQEQVVTQGMGAGAALGSYAVGNNVDPETARVLRRYVTNVAGRQGLLAGLGFTAGQANRTGQPLVSPQTLRALEMSLPLPTAAPLTDLIEGVAGQGRVPRGAVPGVLYDFMYPTEARRRLRPISSGRRSGPRRRTE